MKDKKFCILHLEDDRNDAELISNTVKEAFPYCEIKNVDSQEDFLKALETGEIDLILSDAALPKFDGFLALSIIREKYPRIPFILVSGTIGEEFAIDSLHRGATDYILKHRLLRLVPAINRALKEREVRTAADKQAEEVRLKEEELQILFDLIPARVFFKDTKNNIVRVNKRAAQSVGRSVNEMEGKPSSEIFGEKAEKYYIEDLEVIKSATAKLGIVERIKSDSGRVSWFRTDKVPFIDKDGSVRGIVVTTQDITADKEAEQKLIQQGSLINKAQDAILVLDLNHKVIFWNNSAARLYRWPQSEIAKASIREELYTTPETFDRAMEILMIEGEWSGEIQQKRRDGRKLTVESSWTLVRDDSGEAESILCINSDVTDRKALEQQFLRAQRLDSIGTLASGIAHDLNNVLAPILLSLQMLKMDERDPEKIETLITIEASAKRGAEMVKQVLSFAKGAGGTKTELQLKYLVHEIEKIVSETFAKNIQLEVAVEPSLWTILGDSTQLHQLLLNLCVNARDAMPDGGRLTIRVQNVEVDDKFQSQVEIVPGSYVSIEVEDTGCGIPPEIIDKIFDPFFTTKDVDKGTGLGLSTSMGIVKDHDGVIHVYSEPGKGSRFRVYIPAKKSIQSAQFKNLSSEIAAGKGELILIVDDESAMRSITGKTLQAFGYNTLTASDGEEALAIYFSKKQEISLVITDMMMPVVDGATLIDGIKKLNPNARIISISGINHKRASLLDAGVRHFLLKPYTADKLLSTIKEALEE